MTAPIMELSEALAGLTGQTQQDVLQVFYSCSKPSSDASNDSRCIDLNQVETALHLEEGFFRKAIGR
jgi:hypothetical protein